MKNARESLEALRRRIETHPSTADAEAHIAETFLAANTGEKGLENHPPNRDGCTGCQRMAKYLANTRPEHIPQGSDISYANVLEWADRFDRYMLATTPAKT